MLLMGINDKLLALLLGGVTKLPFLLSCLCCPLFLKQSEAWYIMHYSRNLENMSIINWFEIFVMFYTVNKFKETCLQNETLWSTLLYSFTLCFLNQLWSLCFLYLARCMLEIQYYQPTNRMANTIINP